MQAAIVTSALLLTILSLVGNYPVGISHCPHGSFPVSRRFKVSHGSTWRLGFKLIGQTRYLFFRFGKRIRECTFRTFSSFDPLVES